MQIPIQRFIPIHIFTKALFRMFGVISLCDRIDSLLARHASFDSVQKFRYRTFTIHPKEDKIGPAVVITLCAKITNIEDCLRSLAQREEDLRERYSSLMQRAISKEDKEQLSKWLEELEEIPRKYWVLERGLYQREAGIPRGSLLRAYNLWRSYPKWWLHPDLINDCAGRGGCCGRACGCCERRGQAVDRRRSVGHCTLNCGCCVKSRGFDARDTNDDLKKLEIAHRALEKQNKHTYSHRMLRNYFFGIGSGVDAAPRWG